MVLPLRGRTFGQARGSANCYTDEGLKRSRANSESISMKKHSALKLVFIAIFLPLNFNGCAIVADGLISTAISSSQSKKPAKWVTLRTMDGDTILLRKIQIDGDTLYGTNEDYSEFKIHTNDVHSFRRLKLSEQGGTSKKNEFKNVGLLAICLMSGLSVGAGIGYAVPLTGHTGSSIPGMDQFSSSITGMFLGGLAGTILFFLLSGEE
jgi:hypothetical protein